MHHGQYSKTWDKPVMSVIGVWLVFCTLTLVTYHKVVHIERWDKSLHCHMAGASVPSWQTTRSTTIPVVIKEVIFVHNIIEVSIMATAVMAVTTVILIHCLALPRNKVECPKLFRSCMVHSQLMLVIIALAVTQQSGANLGLTWWC